MNIEEFAELLRRFAQHPLPAVKGRHVYLWHGDPDRLITIVPVSARQVFDLHTLAATLPKAPYAIEEARQLLRRAIQQHLERLRDPGRQQIVIVSGTDLLSRYRVPVQPFFAVASENLLVVFVVPSSETEFTPTMPLPDYVSLNLRAPLDYLNAALGQPSAVISTISTK